MLTVGSEEEDCYCYYCHLTRVLLWMVMMMMTQAGVGGMDYKLASSRLCTVNRLMTCRQVGDVQTSQTTG